MVRGGGGGAIAVSLHDVEPATFERCALIRDWLDDLGRRRGEFIGLDGDETRRAVLAGRRVLKLAGIQPRGFVAPGYAYTSALRETLATTFDWSAGLGRLHRADHTSTCAPALTLGTSTAFERWISPGVVRLGARMSGDLLRLEGATSR
jgi:predicted deacetylase